MIAVDDILASLKHVHKVRDGYWTAHCPVCSAKKFAVRVTDTGIVFKCWQSCSFKDICAALDLAPQDLFHRNKDRPMGRESPKRKSDPNAELLEFIAQIEHAIKHDILHERDELRIVQDMIDGGTEYASKLSGQAELFNSQDARWLYEAIQEVCKRSYVQKPISIFSIADELYYAHVDTERIKYLLSLVVTEDVPCDDHRADGPDPCPSCRCNEIDRLCNVSLSHQSKRSIEKSKS